MYTNDDDGEGCFLNKYVRRLVIILAIVVTLGYMAVECLNDCWRRINLPILKLGSCSPSVTTTAPSTWESSPKLTPDSSLQESVSARIVGVENCLILHSSREVGTNNSVACIPKDTVVVILQTEGEWARATYEGQTGWLYMENLQLLP